MCPKVERGTAESVLWSAWPEKSAPGRVVARTRQIELTVGVKRGSSSEKAERRPLGWRALAWRRMLEEGVCRNQSELARREGVSTAAVSLGLTRVRRG